MNSQSSRCLDLIGKKFGRLTVIDRADDKIDPKSGKHKTRWVCNCDCGTKNFIALGVNLTSGGTKSCGCLHSEVASVTARTKISHGKKYNTYNLEGEYGIGYTYKGEEFYFDKEDYDKIKDVCWYKNKRGYIKGVYKGKVINMSRLIMNELDNKNIVIDHINADNKHDNRKSNLRVTLQQMNTWNRRRSRNNTSGRTGVCYIKKEHKWIAYIRINNKKIFLGKFENKEDAIKVREDAEIKYFREYKYIGSDP